MLAWVVALASATASEGVCSLNPLPPNSWFAWWRALQVSQPVMCGMHVLFTCNGGGFTLLVTGRLVVGGHTREHPVLCHNSSVRCPYTRAWYTVPSQAP